MNSHPLAFLRGSSPFSRSRITTSRAAPGQGACTHHHAASLSYRFHSNSLFISIPIDLSSDPELVKLEENGVKGRYVSVESVKQLPNGNTEWRMATSSNPGGRIPSFIVESTMASSISAVSTSR
jgi:hypothetical protein